MESMTVLRTWLPPAWEGCEFRFYIFVMDWGFAHVVKVYLIVCKCREL